ncbi:putative peptidoglycan biosynthesis protein MurJ [bacterium BMS3Abin15]|nr:putative peptidoglycan biosynthesis protein MurJ [bacterium BMS3Abin15]
MIRRFVNNKIFNSSPTQSITMAAFIISLAGIASRILGLVRDRILASQFGAGDTLDIYYAAFRVPDLVYNLLVLGALSAAFIPVFTGLVSRDDKKEAWKLSSGVLTIGVIVISLVSVMLAILAPYLMKLVTPGFSEAKVAEAVMFTRIMFLSPLLLGISAVFGGILVSFKKFLVYSLAPIMYNIGIIIGAVFFVKIMGPIGLAWGVVLGAVLHMVIQYPAVKHSGFKYKLMISEALRNSNLKRVVYLMIPRTMGVAATQINLLIITIFASMLATGSLTVFNFANNIQSAPLGLFGIAFAIAVFPTLSSLAAKGDKREFVKNFSQAFRQILFFIIPLSVFIVILRAQLVRVVLGSGKFDWEDTILTFEVLGILALSLFAQSLIPLLTRSFYALQNTKTPFYIALFSETINILIVLMLIGKYQLMGLAVAFSVASVVNMALLLSALRAKFDNLDDKNIIKSVLKISIASLVAGIAVQYLKHFVNNYVDLETFIGVFIQLIASGGAGLMIFILASYLLKLEEFHYFRRSITKRLFKAKDKIEEGTGEVGGL